MFGDTKETKFNRRGFHTEGGSHISQKCGKENSGI